MIRAPISDMTRNNEIHDEKRWERAWRRSDDPNAMRWHDEFARLTWGIVAAMPLILLSLLLATQSGIAGAIAILALLWTGFLAMTFAVYVARADRISGVGKVGWMLSFLFAAPIALPVFWLMHVWNAPRPRALRKANRDAHVDPRIHDRGPISYLDVRRMADSSQGAS